MAFGNWNLIGTRNLVLGEQLQKVKIFFDFFTVSTGISIDSIFPLFGT